MKRTFLLASMVFLLSLGSCLAPKTTRYQLDDAHAALQAGNPAKALTIYEQRINFHETNQTPKIAPYGFAATAAYELGDHTKSEYYARLAMHYKTASAENLLFLSELYAKNNRFSDHVAALEDLVSLFPEHSSNRQASITLFSLYTESGQYEKAAELWKSFAAVKAPNNLLSEYLDVCIRTKDENQARITAIEILKSNPQHQSALEYLGRDYYHKAEDRYQSQMAEYEANKTRKQYAVLLKELEKSTADFKKSLSYFESLYKIDPKPSIALFIGNIYARFGDQANAKKYHQLSR